ncbi:MAG: hypothetical protein JRG81_00035 [Deltaproteobacteria bacterium]|nr:hypothetical protein [Deltaproteobacteria bacterium]MBW2363466.1 hypothetical protein [Deltaproteobacteria bacterium]
MYSVDWVSKIFTIPQSDLAFLSGNNYALSLVDVHKELRRLEWSFTDGLWALRIANWYETVTLSGIAKTPSVEIINGYTFDFTGNNYNVILTDYDNNLIDVYIPSNGISILSNNSVGKQTISVGSGLTTEEHDQLMVLDTDYLKDVIDGKKALVKNGSTWELIIYDPADDITPILNKEMKDKDGADISDLTAGILAQELANSV